MHKKLIFKAFEKAKASRKKLGEKKPSVINQAEDISNYIFEAMNFRLGERSFRDYYCYAKKIESPADDINIKQLKVITGLCQYLGFDDYYTFKSSSTQKKGSTLKKFLNLMGVNKPMNRSTLIGVIGIPIIASIKQRRWMLWKKNRYIEIAFNAEEFRQGRLKIYTKERIKLFKKIIPDDHTQFFKKDGTENLWYGKNTVGELEYFTDLARHPETEKTLKPITKYIVKKYIYESHQ